ncbi:MAG: hypothetical protein ACJ79A_06270 [Gemmatimonadaceae bacterium]
MVQTFLPFALAPRMLLVFRYFWFIAAAFMLINIAIWRRRLAVLVATSTATSEEMSRFARSA